MVYLGIGQEEQLSEFANTPLRCAVVGYGYMGEIRRAVIERHEGLELVGIAEPSDATRQRIVADCPIVAEWRTLLASQSPDIVFVCTPNRFIPDITVEALGLGMHVFCEKPPGRTLADVARMRDAEAASSGCKLMFGFNHRFHPGIVKAKVLVDSGRLGRVVGVRGIYGKSGGVNFHNSWRNDKAMSGGGILLDQGIHMLDLFRYFCGDFAGVKCFLDNTFWGFDIEDNAYVILHKEEGVSATLHSSATLWKHTFRIDLICEDGYIVVDGLLSKSGSYGRERMVVGKRQFEDESEAVGNPSEEVTYFDRDMSWDLEVAEFVRVIMEEESVTTSSSEDAYKVMEIVEKAYADARGGTAE